MAKAISKKPAPQGSKKGNETTSVTMATIAAKALSNPKSTKLEKQLAAALLTQSPDKKVPFNKKVK